MQRAYSAARVPNVAVACQDEADVSSTSSAEVFMDAVCL